MVGLPWARRDLFKSRKYIPFQVIQSMRGCPYPCEFCSVSTANGKSLRLNARNNSASNKYIKSVRLNGQPQNRIWFRHADVVKGLTVDLEMSDTPNTTLGADVAVISCVVVGIVGSVLARGQSAAEFGFEVTQG